MTTLPSINPRHILLFQRAVWDYYRAYKRTMPWRTEPTPYYVLVSEMMLQQTQVARVQQKFASFIRHFPTVQDLASAPLGEVLEQWSGLGYNRRAKFLWQTAQKIMQHFGGEIPKSQEGLISLPGIGANTAGAILAYAYNEPVVFVETNIRTVYIHHFFGDHASVLSDTQLRHVIALTVPPENPREWYWALMDYGTHLKATIGGHLERVKHYRPQSRFEGSRRQIRGQIVKLLLQHKRLGHDELSALIADERVKDICTELIQEGLIRQSAGQLLLTDS
jgi:A/G-specific adenine glycosylase